MTGFLYYFNGGTGLSDITEHELIRNSLVLLVDDREIND